MKIILFNGPPRCGKDTAANLLKDMFNAVQNTVAIRYSFARPLKQATHSLYGLGHEEHDAYEYFKDTATTDFFGLTPRQAYIKVSEEMVKPILGKDHWGKVFVNYAKAFDIGSPPETYYIISDCGFEEEVQAILDYFTYEDVYLVKMNRPNTSFHGDSRSYINLPNCRNFFVNNDGGLSNLETQVEYIFKELTNA